MDCKKSYTLQTVAFKDIDLIRPLWERLNASHAAFSTHFENHFLSMTFEKRKEEFAAKATKGEVRTDVVVTGANRVIVGYCVSNIVEEIGEIDSLFVEKEYRGGGAGSMLVSASVDWMRSRRVEKITVNVAVGNEKALAFYARFGLFPRLILLTDKNER